MRLLHLLPFEAAFAAALPGVISPSKDIDVMKRDPVPCEGPDVNCVEPTPPNHYTIRDVDGVLIYNFKVEGTPSAYTAKFNVYNPNTNWWTRCSSHGRNSPDYQACERIRTHFILNIDGNELTKPTSTVTLKVRWIYAPGALPRAKERARGNYNEGDYKDLVYYQDGDVKFQIDCTSTSGRPTNNHEPNCPQNDVNCGDQPKPGTISCEHTRTITIDPKVLGKGEPPAN